MRFSFLFFLNGRSGDKKWKSFGYASGKKVVTCEEGGSFLSFDRIYEACGIYDREITDGIIINVIYHFRGR